MGFYSLTGKLIFLYDIPLKRVDVQIVQPMTYTLGVKLPFIIIISDAHTSFCYLQSSFTSVFLCEPCGKTANKDSVIILFDKCQEGRREVPELARSYTEPRVRAKPPDT